MSEISPSQSCTVTVTIDSSDGSRVTVKVPKCDAPRWDATYASVPVVDGHHLWRTAPTLVTGLRMDIDHLIAGEDGSYYMVTYESAEQASSSGSREGVL